MVAAAESVNVVDFALIAGHVAARVRAAAIFGPDVVPLQLGVTTVSGPACLGA
jgi:hypothetical protein